MTFQSKVTAFVNLSKKTVHFLFKKKKAKNILPAPHKRALIMPRSLRVMDGC